MRTLSRTISRMKLGIYSQLKQAEARYAICRELDTDEAWDQFVEAATMLEADDVATLFHRIEALEKINEKINKDLVHAHNTFAALEAILEGKQP